MLTDRTLCKFALHTNVDLGLNFHVISPNVTKYTTKLDKHSIEQNTKSSLEIKRRITRMEVSGLQSVHQI